MDSDKENFTDGGEVGRPRDPSSSHNAHRNEFAAAIEGYHLDDQSHWVAELACGHDQHVRHDPPWMNRIWVTTTQGRAQMLGYHLTCIKCQESLPRDR